MIFRLPVLIVVLSALLSIGDASAAQVQVKNVKASSSAPDSQGVSYAPALAVDGRVDTSWVEGEASAGLGDWIEFSFEQEVPLSRIDLYGGNWVSRDFYDRHNRLKSIQVKFSSGSSQKFDLADKKERQSLTLTTPVKTKSVRIVLKEVYPGSTFNDTCLSEIQFFTNEPGPVVENVKARASSALTGDSNATFIAPNLFDGVQDTMWCEGKKDAGAGEWIQLTLPAALPLKELRLLNGVAVTAETYQKNNRVTKLKIDLGGGQVKEVDVPDQFGTFHSIPLDGVKSSSLKLIIQATAPGSSFNDTCLSELEVIADR